MNLYRFLSYALLFAMAVLVVALASMLAELAGTGEMTPEVRRGLIVLVLVLFLALLILLFLLCLARAKERLSDERRLYRVAHGADPEARRRAEEELHRREKEGEVPLRSICDVLVRRKFPRDCMPIPIELTRRPDPCIYSQFYLMSQGQPVTWDNPNVEILLGGVPQDTYNLQPATTYKVRVGIENASPFFDSIGTQTQVNLLTFGAGGPTPTPITSFVVDVPAATAFPGVQREFDWTSPAGAGHYCIQVLITHPNDVNPANNEGWNNTVVRDAQPGETFRLVIPVWNARRVPRERKRSEGWRQFLAQVEVDVDSYILDPAALPTADPATIFAQRAAQWNATVTPNRLTIPPGTAQPGQVELAVIVPPDAQPGTRATFNVSATAGGWPLGGVTVHIDVS